MACSRRHCVSSQSIALAADNEALVEALREGNLHLFYTEDQPFGGFRQDASAVRRAGWAVRSQSVIRRVSAEILGHLSLLRRKGAYEWIERFGPARTYLVSRALTQAKATSAFDRIAACLGDPLPDVRFEAVTAVAALSDSPADVAERNLSTG